MFAIRLVLFSQLNINVYCAQQAGRNFGVRQLSNSVVKLSFGLANGRDKFCDNTKLSLVRFYRYLPLPFAFAFVKVVATSLFFGKLISLTSFIRVCLVLFSAGVSSICCNDHSPYGQPSGDDWRRDRRGGLKNDLQVKG